MLLNKSFGLADVKENIPLKPRNRFMIASISKGFTATAILRLAQEGKISLNGSLAEYLPEYPGPHADEITVRQLLNHTSGIRDFINDDFIEFNLKRLLKWKPEISDLIHHIGSKTLLFRPGESYSYSNSGYVLLAAIVEKVTHISYEEYIRSLILNPLKLSNTGFGKMEPGEGYTRAFRGSRWKKRPTRNFEPNWTYGLGGMYSNAADLVKWGRSFRDTLILNQEWRKIPFDRDSAAVEDVFNLYGLGWELGRTGLNDYYSHGGYFPGWASYLLHYPDTDLTIVVLSNYADVDPFEVAEQMAHYWFWNNLPRDLRDAHKSDRDHLINGEYHLEEGELEGNDFWMLLGSSIEIRQKNDRMQVGHDFAWQELQQISLHGWQFEDQPWLLEFEDETVKITDTESEMVVIYAK
ncbi:MAG: beta-lactamase family protein [Bacteroidia bacterium]|nr:beta-lactamase family protein [Bacteroidia bacterium]